MVDNIEYEYSFRIKEIDWFIKKCESIGPKSLKIVEMDRTIYKNGSNTIARLTITTKKNKKSYILDFKQDTPDEQLIKIAKESSELEFCEDNMNDVKALLENLGYKESINIKKKRNTYNFNKIRVELDEYIEPEAAVVVEIEGDKKAADEMYENLYNKDLFFELK